MLSKFAAFEITSALLVPRNLSGRGLRRWAHRHNFAYEPRPGFLYVRSRAISSRCNDNFDEFPAQEIEKAYQTFIGKPVFVNHHNDNHRRARGVVIDAALHKDALPDGAPDTWVEVLMEVDAVKFPKLAQAIISGHIDRTSMGTDVAYSLCSVCGNKATTPAEYCQHIPKMKGQRIYRTTASGRKEGILVREKCYGLKFFENSLLVEEPADPTAFTFGVDTRGLDQGAKMAVSKGLGASFQNVAKRKTAHPEDPNVLPFHQKVRLDPRSFSEMSNAADAGQAFEDFMRANDKRVVDTSNPHELRQHLTDAHAYDDDEFNSRNSFERELGPGHQEDRPLSDDEMARLHERDHTSEGFGRDWPNAVTLDNKHRHEARLRRRVAHTHVGEKDTGPTHAGVVLKAADTGRILMLQRALQDEKDPAAGKWEFPGGGREDGDHNSLSTGLREFAEEVGHPVPPGGNVSHVWRSPNGVYQGHVVVVPEEKSIPLHEGRGIDNPDDPDGDYCEQSAWWHPDDAKKNPALRDEVKHTPWDEIKKASLGKTASTFEDHFNEQMKGSDFERAHRQQQGEELGKSLWDGFANAMGFADGDHMRVSRQNRDMEELHKRYKGQPGSFHFDSAEEPYYRVDHPSGWQGRMNVGPYMEVSHKATGDAVHELVDLGHHPKYDGPDRDEEPNRHASEEESAGWVNHWAQRQGHKMGPWTRTDSGSLSAHCTDCGRSAGVSKEDGGYMHYGSVAHAPCGEGHSLHPSLKTDDPATNHQRAAEHLDSFVKETGHENAGNYDPRIERWNKRKGITGAKVTKTATKAVRHTAPGGGEHAPYRLKEEGGRWFVVNDLGEKKEDKGYATKDEAREHQKALYANVPGASESAEKEGSRKVGYGEIKAPADVDTLRDEECPVCGEKDAFGGKECQVCGYVAPPEMFTDPDLDLASELDLRKDVADDAASDPNNDGMPDKGLDPDQKMQYPGAPGGQMQGDMGEQADPNAPEMGGSMPMDPNALADPDDPAAGQVDAFGNPLTPATTVDNNGQPVMHQQIGPTDPAMQGQDIDNDGTVDVSVPQSDTTAPDGQVYEAPQADPSDLLTCPSCGFESPAAPPQSVDMQQAANDPLAAQADGLVEGDVCPNCGQAALMTQATAEQNMGVAGQGDALPSPVSSFASPTKGREASRAETRRDTVGMGRPVMAAVNAQQKIIDRQNKIIEALRREAVVAKSQLVYLARMAGVSEEFDAIRRQADALNPASPVPDPPSQPAFETTEQALQSETNDNVQNVGQTPGSVQDLAADTTTNPLVPGETLPTDPFNNLQDVTAPVAGTETHVPNDQTRIETDVRVGNPMNPETAYPWTLGEGQRAANRTMASLRLARLRIAAGTAEGDDLNVAARIEADASLTDNDIEHEINTLAQVTKAAARRGRPTNVVPKVASQVQRTVPSLSPEAASTPMSVTAGLGPDVGDADLFLGDFD